MSDESNQSISVNEGMADLSNAVDQAVSSNSQDSAPTITKDAYGNPTGTVEAAQSVAKEAKAIIKDPNASKSQKQAAAKTLKKLTLKIDGQEFEEELPFEIPNDPKAIEYMRRELQMGKMGQKRAQEKATIEKEVLQFIEDLKKNPRKALSDPAIGMDLKKFAAQIIEEEIENSKKSPEQLELEKAQEELKAIKEEREKEQQDRKKQEHDLMTQRYAEQYDNEISAALEGNKIPKSPQAVKKLADYMEIALQANKDVSFNDLIPIVREELIEDYQKHLDALPDDELESYIGKKTIDRIRKRNVAKAKQTAQNPALKAATKVPNTGKVAEPKADEPKKSYKDFFKLGVS